MLRPLALLVVALVAGCLGTPGPEAPGGEGPPAAGLRTLPAVVAMKDCETFFRGGGDIPCFEPTVTANAAGRVVVAPGRGDRVAATDDAGATFVALDPPPAPEGAPSGASPGDVVVEFDGTGRLWWSALYYNPEGMFLPQAFSGIQVARSDDAGVTWAVNRFLNLGAPGTGLAPITDRQWLAVGGGDVVYLTYWQVPAAIWISRSADAGATWSPFVPVTTTAQRGAAFPPGAPVVLEGDVVVVPYFARADPSQGPFSASEIRVSISGDGGSTFQEVLVAEIPGGSGGYWPALALDGNGTLHAAFTSFPGEVLVASSTDAGRTWSAPERWNAEDDAARLPPAIAAGADGLRVAWFSPDEENAALTLARRGPDGIERYRTVESIAKGVFSTDFADLALLPDGRAVVVWTDAEKGTHVAWEAPSPR